MSERDEITAMHYPNTMTVGRFLMELRDMAVMFDGPFRDNMANLFGRDAEKYPEEWAHMFLAWNELNLKAKENE
jgi:hypothetical protein